MKIESLKIKNFKALKDVLMEDIPSFCVIVGANGTGKTTLFDVFGFLKDCLTYNVSQAMQSRGGFHELVSRGCEQERISFELKFRLEIAGTNRLVTYILEIGTEDKKPKKPKKPIIKREILRYKRGPYGSPYHFLDFADGKGFAITNEEDFKISNEGLNREEQELDSHDTLAIKGIGQFQRFKAANAFRQLIENWYVSDFHINLARGSKDSAGYNEHLSVNGDNLQLVANNLHENHPEIFKKIIEQMKLRVPGIGDVQPEPTADGRLLLKFKDGSFKDPFIDKYVSDGTLKMFAYLILLYAPKIHPLLCIEEPENQLYPKLLQNLGEEFEAYSRNGGQVFVSTHSPEFLNATGIENVYWFVKKDGYAYIKRAKDDKQITRYMAEGDKMGYLWDQGLFEGVDPQ